MGVVVLERLECREYLSSNIDIAANIPGLQLAPPAAEAHAMPFVWRAAPPALSTAGGVAAAAATPWTVPSSGVLRITGTTASDTVGITAVSVLVGDANLDGRITVDDYLAIDTGYLFGGNTWARGDFDHDGAVTAADYALVDYNYQYQGTPQARTTSMPRVTLNGQASTYTEAVSSIQVYCVAGNDNVTIDSSIKFDTSVFGGTGSDTIVDRASGHNTLVTIGGGNDDVTGNGVNTNYWIDPAGADTVHAGNAETSGGYVHAITAFFQPWTTNTASPDYVGKELNGPNLRDPTDQGVSANFQSHPFWGTAPAITDIRQGSVGDCYFLADLESLAWSAPERLRTLAADLGDGTYAVQFKKSGVTSYVRVDADLAIAGPDSLVYARWGPSGAIWAPIMEKAYTYFRTAGTSTANTYASLANGWTGNAFNDLGVANNTVSTATSAGTLYNSLSAALSSGKAVSFITNSTVASDIPLIASHGYALIAAVSDAAGIRYQLGNPWGYDGAGLDSNVYDGLVWVTASQLASAIQYGSVMV